ncbi:MAG: hypothetical protein CVU50_00430 [Candidatus Cloacimonetes bacterium HGW-Cloacimonetes-3]|jgi:hypothetical protein|nr:MAG: hypothetical protein CVU50_00430 [Candidatus Cloacimonetes bacterium HGW-Cloacimonetes-3]
MKRLINKELKSKRGSYINSLYLTVIPDLIRDPELEVANCNLKSIKQLDIANCDIKSTGDNLCL